jgi:hypothetical protein
MTNDALEAALNASATAGMSIVKGGIRPNSTTTRRGCTHEPGGVTINTSHTDKW